MSPKNEAPAGERRRFQRLPVMEGAIEPITVAFGEEGAAATQPALLVNLSAGGMSLLLFTEPPRTKRLQMVLNLPGLKHIPIEGRIVRMHEKGRTYNLGIAFTKISKANQRRINLMAQDHMDCRIRIALRLPEVCVPKCRFHSLCDKAHKTAAARRR